MSHSRVSAQTKKAFKDYFASVDLNNPEVDKLVDKLHDDLIGLIPSEIQDTTGRALPQEPEGEAARLVEELVEELKQSDHPLLNAIQELVLSLKSRSNAKQAVENFLQQLEQMCTGS